MRPKLCTTARRLIAAAFLGFLVFAAAFAFVLLGEFGKRPFPGPPVAGMIGFLMASLVAAAVYSVMAGVPWLILHLLRAKAVPATVLAALIGAASAVFGKTPGVGLPAQVSVAVGSALVCGLATALVWWVAYPRKLQAAPLADAFA